MIDQFNKLCGSFIPKTSKFMNRKRPAKRAYQVNWGHDVFAYNFLQERATAVRVVSLCSAQHGASNDMLFYLFWPSLTSRSRDLRSNFELKLAWSKHTFFEASRRDEHDGVRILALAPFFQKLSAKNHLVIFGHLTELWRHQWPKTLKSGIIGFLTPRTTPSSLSCRAISIRGRTAMGAFFPSPPHPWTGALGNGSRTGEGKSSCGPSQAP